MSQHIFTVTQLVNKIKDHLTQNYPFQHVTCVGEVSNLTLSKNGHCYFSIKDDKSKINCVMFASAFRTIDFTLKDGLSVQCVGTVTVYTGTGSLQVQVQQLILAGEGQLYQQYLQLRKSLYLQGYFDQEHKKQLPLYPLKIGIIVGEKSAALADITSTLNKRWPIAKLQIMTPLVQGNSAWFEINEALLKLEQQACDVILLARGGGSLEDLWAFNHPELVKTIYQMNTPLITGVGHEIDVTLVDYVADLRGLTPTDAAIKATPHINDVLLAVDQLQERLINRVDSLLSMQSIKNERLIKHHLFTDTARLFAEKQKNLNFLIFRLKQHLMNKIAKLQQNQQLLNFFQELQVKWRFQENNRLQALTLSLQHMVLTLIKNNYTQLSLLTQKLELISPLNLLKKGYVMSFQDGKMVKKRVQLRKESPIQLQYADGLVEVFLDE